MILDSEVADKIVHLRDAEKQSWRSIANKHILRGIPFCKRAYHFRKAGGIYLDEILNFLRSFPPEKYTVSELWEILQSNTKFKNFTSKRTFNTWISKYKIPAKHTSVSSQIHYNNILTLKNERGCSLKAATKTYFKDHSNITKPKDIDTYIKGLVWYAYKAGIIK